MLRGRARQPADLVAGVVRAVGDDRPAVVAAGLDDVELVAPHRSVLRLPDRPCVGVHVQSQRVADAEGVDLGAVALLVDEGVVERDRAVVVQAQHFTRVVGGILGVVGVADPVPRRHPDRHDDPAVASEGNARSGGALRPGVGYEDVLDVGQRGAPVEPRARQRDRRRVPHALEVFERIPRLRLGVGEVDQPVLGEPRVQRDVHQPRVDSPGVDLGHARDRLGVEHAVADDAQASCPLRDQDVPVRQDRERPRPGESGDRHDAEELPVRFQDPRAVRKPSYRWGRKGIGGLPLGHRLRAGGRGDGRGRNDEDRTKGSHFWCSGALRTSTEYCHALAARRRRARSRLRADRSPGSGSR